LGKFIEAGFALFNLNRQHRLAVLIHVGGLRTWRATKGTGGAVYGKMYYVATRAKYK